MTQQKLSKVNSVLTIIVVLLGIYIAVSPLLPAITNWWQRQNAPQSQLTKTVANGGTVVDGSVQGNRLSIPVLNLDELILDNPNPKTVNNGVWRIPYSSQPGQGSNTVLVGHRFSYNPGIAYPFYSLDVVKMGDSIGIYWNETLYPYTVTNVLTVPPEATYIEAPTNEEQLTIYTCTPLWTSTNRLVVIAKPTKDVL